MSHHTWIHKIARVVVVRPLMRTRVTPNQMTTVRLAVGLGAAFALAVGIDPWPGIGAGLFVASMLLDRADGDYARMTGQTSPGGHKFDLIADSLCNSLVFVGLGLGLRESPFGYWAVVMGLAAGIGVATILMLVIKIEEMDGARAAEIGGFAGFDPDDAMLAVPLAVWLGWSQEVLIAATVGAPGFALFFAVLFRHKLKAAKP